MRYPTIALSLLLAGTSQAKQHGFLKGNGDGTWIIGNDVWNMTQEKIYGSKLYYKDQELVGEATGHYVSYSKSPSFSNSYALLTNEQTEQPAISLGQVQRSSGLEATTSTSNSMLQKVRCIGSSSTVSPAHISTLSIVLYLCWENFEHYGGLTMRLSQVLTTQTRMVCCLHYPSMRLRLRFKTRLGRHLEVVI
jgi:hypothetical protein